MSDCESSNSPPKVIQSCARLPRCDKACSIIICVLMQMRKKLIFYWPQNKGFFKQWTLKIIISYPPTSLNRTCLWLTSCKPLCVAATAQIKIIILKILIIPWMTFKVLHNRHILRKHEKYWDGAYLQKKNKVKKKNHTSSVTKGRLSIFIECPSIKISNIPLQPH